jgi:hypothetical protein
MRRDDNDPPERGKEAERMRSTLIAGMAASLALAGCGTDSATEPAACQEAGGGMLTARIDGRAYCAVQVADAPIMAGYRQLAGVAADGRVLHLIVPLSVGSHELRSGGGIGGSYQPDANGPATYISTGETGRITVASLEGGRARGTFDFVAAGFDKTTAEPLNRQVSVTEGTFDVALTGH